MVESARCMTWKEFKESLYNMSGKKVMYIDEEGTEIPINTEAEFQEALRLAKRQGNRVRFVLIKDPHDEKRKLSGKTSKSKDKYAFKEGKHSKGWLNDADYKESKEAMYVNNIPPEWFLSYMKKFKKDFMAEVNNTIYESIRKAFKKEARLYDERLAREYEWDVENNCVGSQYYYRSENGYETPAYFMTRQPLPASGAVKIRTCLDQLVNDRRSKQYVKVEKTRVSSSSDRRQKPDFWMSVPTMGTDERMRNPIKSYPKVYVTYVHDFGPIKPIKSASFTSNLSLKKLEVLQPYALWFLLGNNGSVPWSENAFVKCFYNPEEFEFEDNVIELPSLEPGVGANVVYEVTPLKVGSYSFTCAIIDNGSEIGDRILCRFEVVDEEGKKIPKAIRLPTVRKESQKVTHKVSQKIKERFDEEFTNTQKKIKENIKTIMKRLDDIEVLSSDTIPKAELKKKEEDLVKLGQKRNRKKRKEGATVEQEASDLLQNLESIRENEEGKPKYEKEIVNDKLVKAEDKNQAIEDKKDKEENNRKKNEEEDGNFDCNQSSKDDSKMEASDTERRGSDSDLSVIVGSEDDDNFIVLSMPSRTPSPEMEVDELDDDQDMIKEKEMEMEMEKEKQKQKEKEMEMEKEKQKQKEMEMEMEKEKQKQKEKEMEMEKEKQKEMEKEKEKQKEMEMKKQKEMEMKKQKELEMEKQKEMEKEKGKAKEKDAEQKESPRRERRTFHFEGNIFDQWNVMKNEGGGRFDPWNEKKEEPDPKKKEPNPKKKDPFDNILKDAEYLKKWGFHVFSLNVPENAAKFKGNKFCVLDTMNIPADMVTHLKNNNIINKDGVFLSQDGTGNVVFVVDAGGKCMPVCNEKAKESAEAGKPKESAEAGKPKESAETGKPKESAETGKPKENAEAGKQKKSAEVKENKEKETKGEGWYGTQYRGSGIKGEQAMNSPGLLLFGPASNNEGSAPNNTSAPYFLEDRKMTVWPGSQAPYKIMEMLSALEDMGFTDSNRNRYLLMEKNFNLFAVIQELLKESRKTGFIPNGGVYAIKSDHFGLS